MYLADDLFVAQTGNCVKFEEPKRTKFGSGGIFQKWQLYNKYSFDTCYSPRFDCLAARVEIAAMNNQFIILGDELLCDEKRLGSCSSEIYRPQIARFEKAYLTFSKASFLVPIFNRVNLELDDHVNKMNSFGSGGT